MLVVWSWRSFFRSFALTFLIVCMAAASGAGIQAAIRNTQKIGYGVEVSGASPWQAKPAQNESSTASGRE